MANQTKPDDSWKTALGALFAQAAAVTVEHGLDLDAFMHGAWSAYVEARPGMREHLEDLKLRARLDELRESGRIARA